MLKWDVPGWGLKYELKKLDVYQSNCKLEEKIKIVNEAKKAYTKVIIFIYLDNWKYN